MTQKRATLTAMMGCGPEMKALGTKRHSLHQQQALLTIELSLQGPMHSVLTLLAVQWVCLHYITMDTGSMRCI